MLTARLVLEGTREEIEAATSGPGPLLARVEAVDIGEAGALMRAERRPLSVVAVGRMTLPSDAGAGPFVRVYIDSRQEAPSA